MMIRSRSGTRVIAASAALLMTLALAAPAQAQRQQRGRLDQRLMKNSPALQQAVGDVVESATASTVRIFVGDEAAALGTVIRADGYVLTKASELEDGFQVELADGRRVAGNIVGVMKEHDLAAVKVQATGLTPAIFSTAAVNAAAAGQWLCSTGVGDDGALVIGNLSVPGLRRIPGNGSLLGVRPGPVLAGIPVYRVDAGGAAERAGLQPGDLIIRVNKAPISTMNDLIRTLRNGPLDATYDLTISRGGEVGETALTLIGGKAGVTLVTEAVGVLIMQVEPGSGAEAAGMAQGDIVLEIDGRPVRDPQALVNMIQGYSPDDEIEVTFLREGDERIVEAKLGYRTGRSDRGDFQNKLGTQLSARAVDFPAVLQHDSILNANQMGGPLVDLKGQVLGINIARAGRVETYALPAQVIEAAIPELLSGKLPTATSPAVTESGKPPVQQELGEE